MSSIPEKKVLIITAKSDRPETEIYLRLKKQNVNLLIFCDPDAPEMNRFIDAGITVVPADFTHMSRSQSQNLIRSFVQEHSIDVVYAPHTHTLNAAIRALKDMEVKLIGYRGTTGHLSIFDLGPRTAYTSSRVDKIVCVSDAVKIYLQEMGIDEDKLLTIRKGHKIDWYKPAARQELEQFGVPDNAFVVGFSGKVRTVKGVQFLIKSLNHINPDLGVHLLIVGEMADRAVKRLIARPEFIDRIHCTGFRSDATSLMGACDAFVMPSLKREGLPKALVEAMAQGVPSIGARAGGIPEIIVHNVSGLLVPPRSSAAIAENIILLCSDKSKAKELGNGGKSRINEVFNIDDTVAHFKELFHDIG